jgi:hypothetical protein
MNPLADRREGWAERDICGLMFIHKSTAVSADSLSQLVV